MTHWTTRMLTLAAGLLVGAGAVAQEAAPAKPEPKETQPATQPKTTEPPKKGGEQPSLDELLGLPKASPKPGTAPEGGAEKPAAPDPNQAALERKLTSQEISEQFVEATKLMAQTADRIEHSRDTSIATQRIQEDIIRKLDQLIESAKKQQRQSQSRSRSQSQDQQNQPAQSQGQQQQQQSQAATTPSEQSGTAPQGNDATLNPEVARGAAWGALPERVRDALLQGNAEKYSSMYQKWTEAYYRKLAEEAGR